MIQPDVHGQHTEHTSVRFSLSVSFMNMSHICTVKTLRNTWVLPIFNKVVYELKENTLIQRSFSSPYAVHTHDTVGL